MNNIKLGIVDDNKDFCDLMVDYFSYQKNIEVIFFAYDGLQAIEEINKNIPDVLILDLIMPHLDGLGVLEILNNLELKKYPQIIMISAVGQDSIIQKAVALGAEYYLVKPINLSVLTKRIKQIVSNDAYLIENENQKFNLRKTIICKNAVKNNDLEIDITNLIHEVGIPPHIKGYQYLRDAITIVIDDMDILSAVTKELYPSIAKINNTTPSRVERAIRHAINVAWSRNDSAKIDEALGYISKNDNEKPTNSELIATIADKLRLERKVG